MFIDDIFVYSSSENEHTNHFNIVLQVLMTNNSLQSLVNVSFWLRFVAYLGNIVSGKGIEVDPNMTSVIKSYPRPVHL